MSDEPEMIERVAGALEEVYASATFARVDTWDAYSRAAIAAMRTPDDSMIRAGNLHREVLGNTGISIADTWSTYEAMIDAALAGSRTPPDRRRNPGTTPCSKALKTTPVRSL